jgi:hypothetical protein
VFLRPDEGTLDQVLPRSRGGRDTWENLVWSSKDVNARKANRLPHEAGLKLLKTPRTSRVAGNCRPPPSSATPTTARTEPLRERMKPRESEPKGSLSKGAENSPEPFFENPFD